MLIYLSVTLSWPQGQATWMASWTGHECRLQVRGRERGRDRDKSTASFHQVWLTTASIVVEFVYSRSVSRAMNRGWKWTAQSVSEKECKFQVAWPLFQLSRGSHPLENSFERQVVCSSNSLVVQLDWMAHENSSPVCIQEPQSTRRVFQGPPICTPALCTCATQGTMMIVNGVMHALNYAGHSALAYT